MRAAPTRTIQELVGHGAKEAAIRLLDAPDVDESGITEAHVSVNTRVEIGGW